MKDEHDKRRLDPLTSLRFFAAAMIVTLHAGGRGLGPELPLHFALNQGITFFFVLSGFVLSYNYPRLSSFEAVRGFYVARIARIWPAHIASAAWVVIFIACIPSPTKSPILITIAQLTMTHAWVPITEFITSYNTVSWCISTEFFFYLVFPFLILSWKSSWHWKLAGSFGLACLMWVLATKFAIAPNGTEDGRGNLAYINPLARIFEFTVGMAIYHFYTSRGNAFERAFSGARSTLVEFGTIVVVLASMYVSHTLATDPAVADVLTDTGTMVLNASGFGTLAFGVLIFVFALGKGAVSRFLCARPMVFLGEISFGMYLVHPLFLLYRGQAPGVFERFSNLEVYGLYWATGLVLATSLHFGIERPFQVAIRGWYAGRREFTIRKTIAPVFGFGLITLGMVFLQPSNRSEYPANLDKTGNNLLKFSVSFNNGYSLDGIQLVRSTNGTLRELRFAWSAKGDVSLARMVGVHLLDGEGVMVGQLDYAVETGYRRAALGEKWGNRISLEKVNFSLVKALGVAVYNTSDMESIKAVQSESIDWGGHRLLVAISPDGLRKKSGLANTTQFSENIAVNDVVGDWAAGSGVAHIMYTTDANLIITSETGLKAFGQIEDGRIIVPNWVVSGRLSIDKKRIEWSNRFVWNR